jgi:hypothetical protein
MSKKYRVVKISEKLFLIQKKTYFGWKTIEDWIYEESAKSHFYKLCVDMPYRKEQIILEN